VAFRDPKLPREFGRLLCYDAGHACLHQLTTALRLSSEGLSAEEGRLPRLQGITGTLDEVGAWVAGHPGLQALGCRLTVWVCSGGGGWRQRGAERARAPDRGASHPHPPGRCCTHPHPAPQGVGGHHWDPDGGARGGNPTRPRRHPVVRPHQHKPEAWGQGGLGKCPTVSLHTPPSPTTTHRPAPHTTQPHRHHHPNPSVCNGRGPCHDEV
jgi:hypothetical protein